jgi:hypothetical protein
MITMLGFLSIPIALAATPTNTISISPPFQEVNISATESQKSFVVSITNDAVTVDDFHLSVKDFGSVGEFGGIALLSQTDDYSKKYGLASWISLEKDTLIIPPQKTQRLKITITNKDSLFPGGHYAALLVTSINPETGKEVSLKPVLTSLILARKLGGQVYNLSLESANQGASLLDPPEQINLRFKNTGNIHLIPRGLITVVDPIGREISRAAINENSDFVLPETIRSLIVPLPKEDFSFIPGSYKVNIAYRYVGTDSLIYFQANYFYIGLPALLLSLILASLAILLIRSRAKVHQKIRLVQEKILYNNRSGD